MLIEWDTVYLGDKFCEQVVSEALVLFPLDVIDKSVEMEWTSRDGIGDHVVVLRIESAVFKHSAEEVELADWAKSSFTGALCVVEALIDDPHVRK